MVERGRDKFRKAKPLILAAVRFYRIFPLKICIKLLEHYRGMKGTKGLVLRYVLLKSIARRKRPFCKTMFCSAPRFDRWLYSIFLANVGGNIIFLPFNWLFGVPAKVIKERD